MNDFLSLCARETENRLREYSQKFLKLGTLGEAMSYSLLAGGKRLRPLIILSCAKSAGLKTHEVIDMACAMEMIHTYSLIHDDLPAMDNDDLRRGKPTNHKVFGEAMAILAGDALLNEAHRILIENYCTTFNGMKAALEISSCAGKDGMILGQVLDIESEHRKITFDELKEIHRNKTGALLKASFKAPFLLGGADENTVALSEKIGELTGILFQIQDDILDVTGTAESLGKTPGKDLKSDKNTYVSFEGLEKSRLETETYYKKIRELTAELPGDTQDILELLDMIARRQN